MIADAQRAVRARGGRRRRARGRSSRWLPAAARLRAGDPRRRRSSTTPTSCSRATTSSWPACTSAAGSRARSSWRATRRRCRTPTSTSSPTHPAARSACATTSTSTGMRSTRRRPRRTRCSRSTAPTNGSTWPTARIRARARHGLPLRRRLRRPLSARVRQPGLGHRPGPARLARGAPTCSTRAPARPSWRGWPATGRLSA